MKTLKIVLVSLISGFLGSYVFYASIIKPQLGYKSETTTPTNFANYESESFDSSEEMESDYVPNATSINHVEAFGESFAEASKKSTESVVYIKTISESYRRLSWMDMFFRGGQTQPEYRVGSGSGVIYKSDGYIITNNHVIDGGDQIEVIIKKRVYEAEIIGTDPSTDLAILKIEAKNLPSVQIGSSQELEVGDWVLAVGNPFNLTSTVTAGIVSAKGREINILESSFPIEAFIQTDAAINPGNSGGALVNKEGQLVGINTAILSRTGSYTGYGFAVPVDIATKIADDIINYGEVQKAYWGADIIDLDYKMAEKLEIEDLEGVLVTYIQKSGAASQAGIKQGDLIISFDDKLVNSRSAFEELLSLKSPGDQIKLIYKRDGKEKSVSLKLTNKNGTTEITKRNAFVSESLGVELESVPKVEQDVLGIESGVRINKVNERGYFRNLNIPEGFIIVSINQNEIDDPEELAKILERIRGRVVIEVVSKSGRRNFYSYFF
ncbi:MAG: trypsin-like peptidase domain-containing protein [Bacteroidota bacterium]